MAWNTVKYFPYDPNKFSNCLKAHSYKIYKMLREMLIPNDNC